jgi:hypothetical protein
MMKLNGRVVVDIEVDGVNSWDSPDFADAFLSSAVFDDNGQKLSDEELELLAEQNPCMVNEFAHQTFN